MWKNLCWGLIRLMFSTKSFTLVEQQPILVNLDSATIIHRAVQGGLLFLTFRRYAAGKGMEAWWTFSDELVGVVRHFSTLCPGIVLTPLLLFQFYVTKTNCRSSAIVRLFRSDVCSGRSSQNLVSLNFHWTFDRHIRRRGERARRTKGALRERVCGLRATPLTSWNFVSSTVKWGNNFSKRATARARVSKAYLLLRDVLMFRNQDRSTFREFAPDCQHFKGTLCDIP